MRLVSFLRLVSSWFRSALHAAARIPAPDHIAQQHGSLPAPIFRVEFVTNSSSASGTVLPSESGCVQVGHATFDNHIGFKVQYTFDIAQRHIQQQTDTGTAGISGTRCAQSDMPARCGPCAHDALWSGSLQRRTSHESHRGVSGACTYRTGTRNLLPAQRYGRRKAVTLRLERTWLMVSGF